MKLVKEEKEKKEKALKELDNNKDDEKQGDAHNLHEKKKHENHEHKYEDFMKEVTSDNDAAKLHSVAEAKPGAEKPAHLKKLVKEIMATRQEEASAKAAKKDEDKEDPTYPHTHMFEDYMARLRKTEEKEGFGKNVDQSAKEGYQSAGTFQNYLDLTPAWGQ